MTVVFGRSPSASPPRALGFEVDLSALAPSWRKALRDGPLLPPAISGVAQSEEAVYLELLDPWERTLLATQGRFDPALGYTRPVRGAGDLLDGLTIRPSIAPSAAASLVAGGVPAERLPWLVLAGALTASLLVAAIVLARRERAVARLREDFVSSVSHELRTPLAQIRLFTETLRLDRVRSDEERRRSLAIIDQEARRLTHLVENTLVLARSERGAGRIARRPEDLAAVVRGTLETFFPLAAATGARIEADLPEGVVADVDADGVRQVLVNLLDNAVTYGPPGQRIAVGLARANGRIRITVEDEGPGIPPADRERVFVKFERLARDRETHRSGTGIGLAVARELVQLHGGTIRAEAADRGGARLVVELPASEGAPA